MSPDSTIEIEISAIDNMSKTLQRIEKNTSDMSKEVTKQTKSTSDAFKESTGNLLVLGQAASSVDRLFDSYSNLQLRLENAAIRVEEAQKNQRDAQYNLNKVMADGTSTIADIAKAQDDLDTATNRVSMAQNNQARANNAVTGTYISMGMQVITLVASLPTLITAVVSLATSLWTGVPALYAQAAGFLAISVAGAPLWAIILAIIAAVTTAILIWKNWDTIVKTLGDTFIWLKDNVLTPVWDFLKGIYDWLKDKFLSIIQTVIDAIKSVIDFGAKVGGAIGKAVGIKGTKQSGGRINETGNYILHKGEEVIPKRDTANNGNTIVINGDIYGYDDFKRKVDQAMYDSLKKKITI